MIGQNIHPMLQLKNELSSKQERVYRIVDPDNSKEFCIFIDCDKPWIEKTEGWTSVIVLNCGYEYYRHKDGRQFLAGH